MTFFRSVRRMLRPATRPLPQDRYHLRVVTDAAALAVPEELPVEIRYVCAVSSVRIDQFRHLLEQGYGIGVRSVDQTPERVLQAVDRIAHLTQENTILPWLPQLLREENIPSFSVEELERSEKSGVNLYEEAKAILAERFEFKKLVLVDLHNRCIDAATQQLMREVNADLYPLAIDTIVHRVIFDNAHTRTEVAQSILKALVVVGPIAHALEHILSGLGKVFAASVDDILSEVAELFALHGSGFTWRQLFRRSRILIPVFALATYGAFQVDPLVRLGHIALAGTVFGLSAVALSLTTAIQSIGMYRDAYKRLVCAGKLSLLSGQSFFRLALRQDFTNPARLGLFLGVVVSPFLAAVVFWSMPHLVSNGWVLALLGSTESVVAGITVIFARRIERWLFRSKLEQAIRTGR